MNGIAERAATLDVAVAILMRPDGRVLLAQRPMGKPWEGYWEFPGGKIEQNEMVHQALQRELREELGITAEKLYPWLTQEYRYPEKNVRLHFYRVTIWRGEIVGREGQSVSWEDPAAVSIRPLLPANDKVLKSIALPPVYAITQATKLGVENDFTRIERALKNGLQLLQIREPGMTEEALETFARRVVQLAHQHAARVLINGDESLMRRCGADGVHWNSQRLMQAQVAPKTGIWAASCHNALELAKAAELNADFVVLSPVLPTASHPEATGLGWDAFADLVRQYPIPVYALGGMKPDMLETAMRHGAHGISLLSGLSEIR